MKRGRYSLAVGTEGGGTVIPCAAAAGFGCEPAHWATTRSLPFLRTAPAQAQTAVATPTGCEHTCALQACRHGRCPHDISRPPRCPHAQPPILASPILPTKGNISPTRGITRNGGAVFDVGRAQGAGAWIALVERGGGATFVQKAQRVSEAGAN
jgi:hypothetical protein